MLSWFRPAAFAALTLLGAAHILSAQEAPGQFRDREKVLFYGDSITHGGWYEYYVRLFYATRFPAKAVSVENAGIAGAAAAGSLSRLEKDVLDRNPDTVYMMFGMNDVGRHNYKTAEADEKTLAARQRSLDQYKKGMDDNIKKIKESGAAVVVVTPSPYDQYSKTITTENLAVCNDGLAKCAEIAKAAAAENKCPVSDLYTNITELMKKDPESKLAGSDRVHPGQDGHMVMAYFILQSQKVPGLVAKVSVDYAKKSVESAENCSADGLAVKDGSVKFKYSPKALPFPDSDEYRKANKFVPWDSLNQEIIQVKNLPAGDYRLLADGKETGRFSASQLAAGVNIAALATPGQQKSAKLRDAVIASANADRPLRGLVQTECILWGAKVDPADTAAADKYLDEWLEKKVGEQYKKYYTNVVKNYRENRDKHAGLQRTSDDARAAINTLQNPVPFEIEISR